MRTPLTRIEQFDRKFPGLELAVVKALDAGEPLAEILELIEAKTGQKVAQTTLSNYKNERWLKRKQRIQALVDRGEAVIALLGEHGADDVTKAAIFEQIGQAMEQGAELNPHFLLAEQRKWAQLKLKREQLEKDKQALELKISQIEQARAREQGEIQAAIKDGEKDPQQSIQRIREIYGLGAA